MRSQCQEIDNEHEDIDNEHEDEVIKMKLFNQELLFLNW